MNDWILSFDQARYHWRIVTVTLCGAVWIGLVTPMVVAWVSMLLL